MCLQCKDGNRLYAKPPAASKTSLIPKYSSQTWVSILRVEVLSASNLADLNVADLVVELVPGLATSM